MNNGKTTSYFPLGRSCRQGDALSPYLFILAIEPLIRKIKQDDQIKGYKLPNGDTLKTNVFADDVTGYASCKKDLKRMIKTFENFEKATGLALNKTKFGDAAMAAGVRAPALSQKKKR